MLTRSPRSFVPLSKPTSGPSWSSCTSSTVSYFALEMLRWSPADARRAR
jgi:hypothetical protein